MEYYCVASILLISRYNTNCAQTKKALGEHSKWERKTLKKQPHRNFVYNSDKCYKKKTTMKWSSHGTVGRHSLHQKFTSQK